MRGVYERSASPHQLVTIASAFLLKSSPTVFMSIVLVIRIEVQKVIRIEVQKVVRIEVQKVVRIEVQKVVRIEVPPR
jgi:hypothetical protein